ncbi:MAG: hypothetical protein OEN56_09280 [Gemmatimonadota bacterium]|nr:hypothetical protein [Gemmatimonadota bacterium]
MAPLKRIGRVVFTLSAAALLPQLATAQLSDPWLDRQHDAAIAVAHEGGPGAIEIAVLRHSQVVHERMSHDARRFECLRSHANLLYYSGELQAARLYLEAAAEQAAAQGLDYEAAMTYVDAAILAREAGDVGASLRLSDKATVLASSPRVEDRERTEIRSRIGA